MDTFDLASIMTPKENVLEFGLGTLDAARVAKAIESGYDRAPVVDEADNIVGFASVKHLEMILRGKGFIETGDYASQVPLASRYPSLPCLLNALCRSEIIAVGHDRSSWVGLVHRADIDKHPFRAALYPKISQIEVGLARMIEDEFVNPWDWFRYVSDTHRSTVIGSWELAKRERNDSNPVVWLGFPDLLSVAKESEQITNKIGLPTRWFNQNLDGLKSIRNQIMHPVRSFGPTEDELIRLDKSVRVLYRLHAAVVRAS